MRLGLPFCIPKRWMLAYTTSSALLVLLLLASCTNASSGVPHERRPVHRPASASSMGVHMLLTDGSQDWPEQLWESHLQEARSAVGPWGYVIVLLRSDDLNEERWQHFIDLCTELELTPVFRLATTHIPHKGWSAPAQEAEGRYQSEAQRYSTLLDSLKWPPIAQTGGRYVIVGNEPNRGDEWGGRPNPAEYAQFFVDVASALHIAHPDFRVLNAGFDLYAPHTGDLPLAAGYFMDAESFMDGMVEAIPNVFSHVDVWSSHSYPLGPFTAEPSYQLYQRDMVHGAENPDHLPPPDGIYNRGISAYQWEQFKLASYDITDLPILITETGWRHSESVHPAAADTLPNLPTVDTVSFYMSQAIETWQADEQVIGAIFFAFDGNPTYWGHTNWLQLTTDGEISGRYEPLFEVIKQNSED